MNDVERLKTHYNEKFLKENFWHDFNEYPFYLGVSQYKMLIKILKSCGVNTPQKMANLSIIDIGSGNGNVILSMIKLGAFAKNITAIELLKERYEVLIAKIPGVKAYNINYLDFSPIQKQQITILFAVLTSILDEKIRESILAKAYNEMDVGGIMIIYDYYTSSTKQMSNYYKSISYNDIKSILSNPGAEYKIYSNVYLGERIGKGLCMLGLGLLIPLLEKLKVFNSNYSFIVIKKT